MRCWPSGVLRCSLNNTYELTGFAEALRWTDSFIPRGERVRILYDSKHAARVALGVAHAGRNIALANRCIDLFSGPRASSTLLFTVFLATLGMDALIVLPPKV